MGVTKPGGVVCWHVQDQIIDGSESCTIDKQTLFFRDLGFCLYQRIYVVAMSYRKSQRATTVRPRSYSSCQKDDQTR